MTCVEISKEYHSYQKIQWPKMASVEKAFMPHWEIFHPEKEKKEELS